MLNSPLKNQLALTAVATLIPSVATITIDTIDTTAIALAGAVTSCTAGIATVPSEQFPATGKV
ncbi:MULTISPECIES: hypothetical protein [unclassified Microcoleus]|uniref:hypothetical protein n=1 Tax=unclassified Microcoleus TaxID=2642155 RepID=UPI0025EE0930|nr:MULTISPECIES: hypothetical protein [unclassified Microcoleus]